MALQTDQKPTIVLGGTGETGRRIIERLEARGVPTRLGSRNAEPPFDWEDRTTWPAALDGIGVQRALGREPRDFTDYARETAATGIGES